MAQLFAFEPAPADYPNYLAAPSPCRLERPSARWLLLFLVVLCLTPRAVMALRIPSVCPDGVLYIRLAEAVDAGDLRTGFRDMALNTYPMILVGLHRLGLGWEFGAALWGVGIASLVVLPLWGWVRRQFDDRVALAACLLYAVNPKMIEWSPEVMRDPTFWFLFTLAIYWLWRAVTEVRYGYFVGAGAAILLASLTRIEGLFLLIPLTLWTFWRFRALQQGRPKLLFGVLLCIGLLPLILALVNVVWLCQHSGWTAIRFAPLARVQPWLESIFSQDAVADTDKAMSLGRMVWVFIPTMTRGLSPAFALLMFGGIWGWRRVWARRDNQPLFYAAVVVMCGVWVQLWYDKNICPRYALPIVLMASPLAALGFFGLIDRLARIAARFHGGLHARVSLAVVASAAVASLGLGDAMTSNTKYFETRQMAVDMGSWVQRAFSTPPILVGPVGFTPIVSYYAQSAPYRMFRWEAGDALILDMVDQSDAGVVLLRPTKQLTAERCAALVDRLKASGLERLGADLLPPNCDDLYVLVRSDKKSQAWHKAAPVYR